MNEAWGPADPPMADREAQVVLVDPQRPAGEAIQHAADLLRAGELVSFPTETVYGLGADALNAKAVAGIFRAKGRPSENPLIVHVSDTAGAGRVTASWSAEAELLAAAFWPGPLTLVLPRAEQIPEVVTAGGPTVAVRVPDHPVALALLRQLERPLAAPSANRSGEISPTQAEHVWQSLGNAVALILDAGPCRGGLESTVVDLVGDVPCVLRPGLIPAAELSAVLGCPVNTRPLIDSQQATLSQSTALQTTQRSPGLLGRHYAPRARLELVRGSGRQRVGQLLEAGQRVGWICWADEPESEQVQAAELLRQPLSRDPQVYASRLYAVLHDLDAAGVDRIVVAEPPLETDAPGPWLAIVDRLRRAACPE